MSTIKYTALISRRQAQAYEDRLVRRFGLGRRTARPTRLGMIVLIGLMLSLACPALAQDTSVGAWTGAGPAGSGVLMGTRVYLPGLTLTPDLALYVGDSEEPAAFSMCLQHAHGVVCQGVKP